LYLLMIHRLKESHDQKEYIKVPKLKMSYRCKQKSDSKERLRKKSQK
ncbi:MAG: hypothetical protein EZS28_021113, partial [Streblomastix strix]